MMGYKIVSQREKYVWPNDGGKDRQLELDDPVTASGI